MQRWPMELLHHWIDFDCTCVLGFQQACGSGHDWGFTEGWSQHMGEPASINFISKSSCGLQVSKMVYSELFKLTWFGKIATCKCWNGLVSKKDSVKTIKCESNDLMIVVWKKYHMYKVIYPDFVKCKHHSLEERKHYIQYARWKIGEVLGDLCILIDITSL